MTSPVARRDDSRIPTLGIPGFAYSDLHEPAGLARLHRAFLALLVHNAPELAARFDAIRLSANGDQAPGASDLLIEVAEHVGSFVARLFGVEDQRREQREAAGAEGPVFRFKNEFMVKRVFRRGAPDRPEAAEFPALDAAAAALLGFLAPGIGEAQDAERALSLPICELLDLQKLYDRRPAPTADQLPAAFAERCAALREAAKASGLLGGLVEGGADVDGIEGDGQLVRNALTLLDRWCFARSLHPEGKEQIRGWSSYKLPKKTTYEELVHVKRPLPLIPEVSASHELRRRDGFRLTDGGATSRQVRSEVDYCLLCHERGKDSCSKGFHDKAGGFKKNSLAIDLHGCPLEEHISEGHVLKARGDSIAALAMVSINNPMSPGTGHRICNDCMKGCIFQTQEPVNIPLVETSNLRDVLSMPWGYEIWSLLTRWNPVNLRRPYALPHNGKKVLVVGLGPAGYTLAHHLLNEGFGVVAVEGLKVEPLPERFLDAPIRDFEELRDELDQRVVNGFGGVSEYGITVRWDKNFLTALYLNLARRRGFAAYGGVRFGGTLTLDDAWGYGFDHVAIAAGAGRPTLVRMKNGLLRGIRQASDFLMALQLSGAFKRDSMASLQVRLPALVIGGGLTGVDTATELAAYYPIQVEKTLDRWEKLQAELGVLAEKVFDAEEREVLAEFLEHGRAVRAERVRARAAGEEPNFAGLVQQWGGVSLVYRKRMQDAPAYRLNHEEVEKGLEEGIHFVEYMDPKEAVSDDQGAVRSVIFERQKLVDGKWLASGELVELPARTVCVAAGTSPNVTYEREYEGSFRLDRWGQYFQGYSAKRLADGTIELAEAEAHRDLSQDAGFFTSYLSPDKTRCVSFYGDNHPQYAGSVVKAMASAKDGHVFVAGLFEDEVAGLRAEDQPLRDHAWESFRSRLDEALRAKVVEVRRLTPTIVEVVVKAPLAAEHFNPGQFYRLQAFESRAPVVDGTRLLTEGLALTGAWVDKEKGLLSLIVLEMGGSSRLVAALRPGEEVVCMGPTGAPTEIPSGESVLLAGGGLGNAVLFSIAKALKENGNRVLYFAGYRNPDDVFKQDEIEAATDQVIWATDREPAIAPRRPQDRSFVGNICEAMMAYTRGELGESLVPMTDIDRIIAIGSDRMMAAVKALRKGALAPYLKETHEAIGSINSPMQCMMKEICAQCLQRQVGPDGKERIVFTCMNQDQKLDEVDFPFLASRLRANGVQEKIANLWLDRCLKLSRLERI
ncbi:FAD-dependent oxidoreductase [Vulgatibacter incomptus]|uniref:Glutamate synthase [NADPH] small chain n=1 Tax=Vulgatibacter incomptus TaxID=1391653 RepID=A0A0K1PD31_9BACT|nr:FAD-dependent oxidoreductase [Vulgatibacter incomptus]AKU91306.1 Glutamate synthase [NADPH] small chain [Vulgatibacter incomptus]